MTVTTERAGMTDEAPGGGGGGGGTGGGMAAPEDKVNPRVIRAPGIGSPVPARTTVTSMLPFAEAGCCIGRAEVVYSKTAAHTVATDSFNEPPFDRVSIISNDTRNCWNVPLNFNFLL
jgi:hypothetical protein